MSTYRDFFTDVLNRLNLPVTDDALNAFYAVCTLEGYNTRFNPLNSVVPSGDSTPFNDVGVQDYKSYDNGISGTVSLLEGEPWVNVVSAIRNKQTTDAILSAFANVYDGWRPNTTASSFPRNDGLGTVTLPGTQTVITPPVVISPKNGYHVEPNDSLWSIAAKLWGNGALWAAIAKANNIEAPYVIHPGDVLTIPANPGGVPSVATHTNISNARSYTVISGDTLWGIAEHFYGNGAEYPRIASANGIGSPYLIHPDQVLRIP